VIVVGIDPGQSGGLAVLGEEPQAMPMPLYGKEIDAQTIAVWLRKQAPHLVVIEQAQSMPKQGLVSTFRFGMHFGVLIGIVETLGLPFRLVRPQVWKQQVLIGTARDKDAAIQHVRRAYPTIDLLPKGKRVPHDGIADAVCIAEWGRSK